MIRIEIITNQAVEEDILELLNQTFPDVYYTLFSGVRGRGRQGVRRGDPIWPEKNALILMCLEKEDTARAVMRSVFDLKKRFPREGIKMFASKTETFHFL